MTWSAVPDAVHAEIEVLRHPPDLILSDVIMPGKSGYELCREMKGNPATRLIPFVLITGLTDRQDRLMGIESGADDFLNKPIFPEELFARVKSLLKLKEFTDELETAESVLCTLGLSVESRDPYTEGHCERLARNASNLGRHLGLDEESIVALRRGGYLHDLGKIAVPDEILKKGTNLTAEEWAVMKLHPITGETICRPLKSLRLVLPIIRNHHEHSDGSGYPDGLRRNEIPLLPGSCKWWTSTTHCARRAPTSPRSATSRPPPPCGKKLEPDSGMKNSQENSSPCWKNSGKWHSARD